MLEPLLGSLLKERILLYLQECSEGYASELAKTFGVSVSMIQFHLKTLEEGGIAVSRAVGKTRIYALNPRYFFLKEVSGLLEKVLKNLPEDEIEKYYRPRKRPRRWSKVERMRGQFLEYKAALQEKRSARHPKSRGKPK
jgi:DNA-binding transcriptional ArsR family regulator